MFLSFIIPAFNAAPYLAECLDSLFKQDIPQTEYEVLVVNDGSTDATGEILAEYCRTHANLRSFSQNRRGVSAARNLGLREAKGDYIWFVDADDMIREHILGLFRQHVSADWPDRVIFDTYVFHKALSDAEQAAKAAGTLSSNTGVSAVSACSSLFRRLFLTEFELRFDEELSMSEDALFLYETALHHPRVVHLRETAYFWRRNPGSTTMGSSIRSLQQKMASQLRFLVKMKDYYHRREGDLSVCADYLMSNLWGYLHSAATLDRAACKAALRQAKAHGLYPCRRPPECTLKKTYMTTRTDLLGKVFDFIGLHLHRPWGFALMRAYCSFAQRSQKGGR